MVMKADQAQGWACKFRSCFAWGVGKTDIDEEVSVFAFRVAPPTFLTSRIHKDCSKSKQC